MKIHLKAHQPLRYALSLMIALTAEGAFAQTAPDADTASLDAKIEPQLMESLQITGHGGFFIRFRDKANFNGINIARMDWQERGRFVHQRLKDTASASQAGARRLLNAAGLSYHPFVVDNSIYVEQGDLATLEALAALPEVLAITEPRTFFIVPPIIDETQPPTVDGIITWGIQDTNADQFWTVYGHQGEGIVVANIDTGVQWNHPALDQAYKCGANLADPACWYDPSNICGTGAGPCDNNGHGTHTMGTMVGDDDPSLAYQVGMAPAAQWIACKGCESNSCSGYALTSCANWLLAPGGDPDKRPHIVNNSWGGGGGDSWYQDWVNAWRAAGIFPAFSAGNSGSSCSTLGSPGDYQASFASAAHGSTGAIASFSSRGPSLAFGHEPYTKPNISAPGVSVLSAVPTNGWSSYSGTSMASPHSAGAVALLWSCNPDLRGQVDQTFQLLQGDADTPPSGNCGVPPDGQGNYTFGYGYLNVLAAGQAGCSSAPPAPVISIADASLTEGNADSTTSLVFTLSRAGSTSEAITVDYATADGSATVADGDYSTASGTVSFSSGVATQTLSVSVLGDTKSEGDENFYVNLSNPTGGATLGDSQATGTILNDDVPLPQLSVNDVTKSEGSKGTTAFTFTLTLSASNPTGVTVDYATQDGTAKAVSDYVATSGTLSFSGTQTSLALKVYVVGDRVKEDNETFSLVLSNPRGAVLTDAQGLGTIRNDDR